MKNKVKISSSVVERLKKVNYDCSGSLHGVFNRNSQYIFGLYLKNGSSRAVDIIFPTEIDMCGFFEIGEINMDNVNKSIKEIDVTDNPIYLSISREPYELNAYYCINDTLELATIEILSPADLYAHFIHVRLRGQVPLISHPNLNSIRDSLLNVRKLITSGKIAFNCERENIFIHSTHENMVCKPSGVVGDLTVHHLLSNNTELGSKKAQTKKASQNDSPLVLEVLQFNMFQLLTKSDEILGKTCAPVIQVEKHNSKGLQMKLNIDALTLVSKDVSLSKLYTILVEAACRNLRLFGRSILDQMENGDQDNIMLFIPEIFHFCPPTLGHFITRIICRNENEDDSSRQKRNLLHRDLLITRQEPLFRRANRYIFNGETQGNGGRIINPHEKSKPTNNGGEQALVQGKYEYYHYLQDNMDDDGWGCAYRSLQTLASWFVLQGYTENKVPSFKDIQQCLFDIGDKPASFVDSRQWIGSTEVSYVLDSLMGVTSKILYVSSGEELASKGPELVYHFNTAGSPIMIGGGVLAHTILGVDYNTQSGTLMFLILDPHYTGREDIQTIVNKGWCGWKGANFWDKKAYYNMCMPQVPRCV